MLKKTQQEIADQCGISKSMLSKIENGQSASALATLSKIAQALNIPLTWIINGQEEVDFIITKKDDRKFKMADIDLGYSYELLANPSHVSAIEPLIVTVTPKEQFKVNKPYTHSQDEFVFIIEGAIELFYNGEKYFMDKGDSAYFKGSNPHLFIPVDNEGATVLSVYINNPYT
ncbi:hypothetical protein AM500_03580 [Bacillus sp. FJAT-18017]|nr:hypothetical protein AM500_03580 [Bacillus sp. FJAT-18017]